MLNICAINGRLTRDPELQQTQNQKYYCRFCVANTIKSGKGEESTDYIDCLAWTGKAEFIARWFKQGDMIALTGRLTTSNYEKQGVKVKSTELMVSTVDFCGTKRKDEQGVVPPEPPKVEDQSLTGTATSEESAMLPFDLGNDRFEF